MSATISGTVKAPQVEGRLSGESLSFAGQHADRLDATLALEGEEIRVNPLVLTQADGRLTVDGRFNLRTSAVTGRLTAINLMLESIPGIQPGEILVPIRGRLNGEWQAGGTIDAPSGSGQVELSQTIAFDREVGRVTANLTLADRQAHAAFELADLFTTGDATLALSGPGAFSIDTQTRDADLAQLASRLGVAIDARVTGLVSFAAHAEGVRDDMAHPHATIDLLRLEGAVGDVPVRSTGPGRASYDGRTLDVAGISLDIGSGGSSSSQVRAAGRLGADTPGTLSASLDGQAGNLQRLAQVFLPADSFLSGLQVDGQVHVGIRARGTLESAGPRG